MDINEFITSIRNLDYQDKSKQLYIYLLNISKQLYPDILIESYPDYVLYYSYTPNYIKLFTPGSTKGSICKYTRYEDYGWTELEFKSSLPDQLRLYIDRFIQDLHKVHSLSKLSYYFYPYVNPCPHTNLHWLSSVMNCYRRLKLPEPDYRTFATLKRELISDIRSKFPHLLLEETDEQFSVGDIVINTKVKPYNETFIVFECNIGNTYHQGSISAKIGMETIVEFYSSVMSHLYKSYPYNYMTLNSYLPSSLQLQSQEQMISLLDLIFRVYSDITNIK